MMGKPRAVASEPCRKLPELPPVGHFESYGVVDGLVFFEYGSLAAMEADRHPQRPSLTADVKGNATTLTDATTQTDVQIDPTCGPGDSASYGVCA